MIEFTVHEKEKVQLIIETGLPVDKHRYLFYWNCENEAFAYLLSEQLRKHYGDCIEAARKEEYERGYKDGRAKRKRIDWFKRWL